MRALTVRARLGAVRGGGFAFSTPFSALHPAGDSRVGKGYGGNRVIGDVARFNVMISIDCFL